MISVFNPDENKLTVNPFPRNRATSSEALAVRHFIPPFLLSQGNTRTRSICLKESFMIHEDTKISAEQVKNCIRFCRSRGKITYFVADPKSVSIKTAKRGNRGGKPWVAQKDEEYKTPELLACLAKPEIYQVYPLASSLTFSKGKSFHSTTFNRNLSILVSCFNDGAG